LASNNNLSLAKLQETGQYL